MYIQNIAFDKDTGEVAEGRELSFDEDKVREQEQYDGYYSIGAMAGAEGVTAGAPSLQASGPSNCSKPGA